MRYWFISILFLGLSATAQYDSWNVEMLDNWRDPSHLQWYGDQAYNEVWGFVQDGQEYAVIGSADGTLIFKITDDDKLEKVVWKQGREHNATHRHYHDYNGYLYEVCDQGKSTLRVHDLRYLPDSTHIVYDDSTFLARSHNIFIDSSSGLLYACGVTYANAEVAMRVLSLSDPENPSFVYDYPFVDYVHDVFVRNDTAYINAAFEGMRVADFSNPTMPIALGSLEFYTDKGYNHSGWLSEDGSTYVLCDENPGYRFKVLNVSDLSDIKVTGLAKPETFDQTLPHNVQLKNGIAYVSYYADGLQIYDVRKRGEIKRIAYFDSYFDEDIPFRGNWGIYAFLPSGRILISDRKNGLFLLNYDAPPDLSTSPAEISIYPNLVQDGYMYFYKDLRESMNYVIDIFDMKGAYLKSFAGDLDYLKMDVSELSNGLYFYRYTNLNTQSVEAGKFIVQKR